MRGVPGKLLLSKSLFIKRPQFGPMAKSLDNLGKPWIQTNEINVRKKLEILEFNLV